jgi:hypothetical protein
MACSVQGRPKKARKVKTEVKSMLIIFFGIKGIAYKEVVQASHAANSTYYCDVLRRLRENVRRLRNSGDKRTVCWITTLPFHQAVLLSETILL